MSCLKLRLPTAVNTGVKVSLSTFSKRVNLIGRIIHITIEYVFFLPVLAYSQKDGVIRK